MNDNLIKKTEGTSPKSKSSVVGETKVTLQVKRSFTLFGEELQKPEFNLVTIHIPKGCLITISDFISSNQMALLTFRKLVKDLCIIIYIDEKANGKTIRWSHSLQRSSSISNLTSTHGFDKRKPDTLDILATALSDNANNFSAIEEILKRKRAAKEAKSNSKVPKGNKE